MNRGSQRSRLLFQNEVLGPSWLCRPRPLPAPAVPKTCELSRGSQTRPRELFQSSLALQAGTCSSVWQAGACWSTSPSCVALACSACTSASLGFRNEVASLQLKDQGQRAAHTLSRLLVSLRLRNGHLTHDHPPIGGRALSWEAPRSLGTSELSRSANVRGRHSAPRSRQATLSPGLRRTTPSQRSSNRAPPIGKATAQGGHRQGPNPQSTAPKGGGTSQATTLKIVSNLRGNSAWCRAGMSLVLLRPAAQEASQKLP